MARLLMSCSLICLFTQTIGCKGVVVATPDAATDDEEDSTFDGSDSTSPPSEDSISFEQTEFNNAADGDSNSQEDADSPSDCSDCCTPHDHLDCFNNDVYWFDSCNNREDLNEDCPYGCSAGQCLPCSPVSCQNVSCGYVPDGCGGMVDCGTCQAPNTCGGSGNVASCGQAPSNCTDQDGVCPSNCIPENDNDCVPSPAVIPTFVLDAMEVFPFNGALGQTVTRGKRWWYRQTILDREWTNQGVLFSNEQCPGCNPEIPNPEDPTGPSVHIDAMAQWQNGSTDAQVFIHDNFFWYRPDTGSSLWTNAGTIFSEGCSYSPCDLPASVDTITQFPFDAGAGCTKKFAQLATKGSDWWMRPCVDAASQWTDHGTIFSGESCRNCPDPLPASGIDSFSTYPTDLQNPIAGPQPQVGTKGSLYVWRPGSSSSSTQWIDGQIIPFLAVDVAKASAEMLSDKIYGVNLIWHSPHTRYYEDGSHMKNVFKQLLLELGVTIIRFPGGCGGDAFGFNPTENPSVPGMTKNDYLQLFRETGIIPFYTLNLEGEVVQDGQGHDVHFDEDLNCHGLYDHPGTINEAIDMIRFFNDPDGNPETADGINLQYLEVGNEPYANHICHDIPPGCIPTCDNWWENWNEDYYLRVFNNLLGRLDELSGPRYVTVADNLGQPQHWASQWTANFKPQNLHTVQAHLYDFNSDLAASPYFFADSSEEKLTSLNNILIQKKNGGIIPQGVGIAVTEYGIPCWRGVFSCGVETPTYPDGQHVHPACGMVASGLYQAKMLGMFIRNHVDLAMIWHFFEDETVSNGWKCGLVRYNGNIVRTPAFEAFKLLSHNLRGHHIPTVFDDEYLYVVAATSTDHSEIKMLIINQEASTKKLRLLLKAFNADSVVLHGFYGSSNEAITVAPYTARYTRERGQDTYQLDVLPFSVSILTARKR